jgi:anion-transporting  ArsA/GET3 family ATPase
MGKSFPRLHIFLGAGGVGKTTLSASFALSLANSGRKVGLLSIDPAKRLQSALGVNSLSELGTQIPLQNKNGSLHASILHINESLMRWVSEKGLTPDAQQKLFKNPYFIALSDKMATAIDTLAAIRVAEWVEQYPEVEDLVIDTAPGIHAIDFIAKPEKVSSFLDSKIIDWIKWFVGSANEKPNFVAWAFKSGARKILDGLALVGGKHFIVHFAEFLTMLDEVFITALERLKYSQKWMRSSQTNIVLITSIREDAVAVVKEIARVLAGMKVITQKAIINRAFPENLNHEIELQNFISQENLTSLDQTVFSNYISSYKNLQDRVSEQLLKVSQTVIEIPVFASLDVERELRLSDLSLIGDTIRLQSGQIKK